MAINAPTIKARFILGPPHDVLPILARRSLKAEG
jgi:hypothetical protein